MYTLLIIFALVSILTSFLCSMWEAVLLSITPSYAQIKLREGTATGKKLKAFKENIDKPLAAILTLNTIAHTVGAIGVGAQSTAIWSDSNPIITSIVIPVVMTAAILVLSEIIPKTIGANYWRNLAPFTVRCLDIIIKLLFPIIYVCQLITKFLKSDKEMSILSRSDFLAMAQIGEEEGVFKRNESEFIKNLLQFEKITVKSIMTPRVVVKKARETMPLEEFFEENRDTPFSRIPVHESDKPDSITGYVIKTDVLNAIVEGDKNKALLDVKREIITVPEDYKLPALFKKLIEKREHMALVVDEFGGLSGIATMEDVIETLLGMEIIDESDSVEDMQALARQNWEKRARAIGIVVQQEE